MILAEGAATEVAVSCRRITTLSTAFSVQSRVSGRYPPLVVVSVSTIEAASARAEERVPASDSRVDVPGPERSLPITTNLKAEVPLAELIRQMYLPRDRFVVGIAQTPGSRMELFNVATKRPSRSSASTRTYEVLVLEITTPTPGRKCGWTACQEDAELIAVVKAKENLPLASVVAISPFPGQLTTAPTMGAAVFASSTTPVKLPTAAHVAAPSIAIQLITVRVRKLHPPF